MATLPHKKNDDAGGVVVALLVIVIGGAFALHAWLDSKTRILPVQMQANSWIVGEYQTCISLGKENPTGEYDQTIADLAFLDCGKKETSESHDLEVKFAKPWFSDVADKKQHVWNCQRKQSDGGVTSLECNLKDVPDK
jgi:hypothetical protein